MVVAEAAGDVSTETRGYAVSPATQPELELSAESHPSLGPTPFTTEFHEPDPPADTGPAATIRRMTLIEKIAFFG